MGTAFFASDTFILIATVVLFGAVILATTAVAGILKERRQRAGEAAGGGQPSDAPRLSIEDNVLQRFAPFTTPTGEEEYAQVRRRLANAGYRRPSAVRIYHMGRAVSIIGFATMAAVAVPLLVDDYPMPIYVLVIFMAVILGYIFPSYVLDRMIASRKARAESGFPDTLDMLLVCIEAGQGFEQATRRIARELKGHNEVLAEELSILNDELWAGKDRATVFRDFAQRLDVSDITAFVGVLRQSDRFGVSIAEAIRVYAADMRFKRVMRAEEKANQMPLKLALASMAFTVPPTMIILVGPALLDIIRSFAHM